MKKNYILKTIQTGLAIFALALSSTHTTAQVATEYAFNLRVAEGTYPAGSINMVSDEIALEGTTFKIQAVVTPTSTAGSSFIVSNASRRWGVDDATIDGNAGETAVIDAISIVDFNDNGTGYTVDAISNLRFEGITLRGINGANDNPKITVNGTDNSGTFELGQGGAVTLNLTFGTLFTYGVEGSTVDYTIGGDDVTSITLTNGEPASFQNNYQVIGVSTSYTFTTNPALSVDSISKNDSKLSIYPTVVEKTFSVNKTFKTLQLFDLTGKTVKSFKTSDALEVSGIRSGLYIVKIQSEVGAVSTGKLIVK